MVIRGRSSNGKVVSTATHAGACRAQALGGKFESDIRGDVVKRQVTPLHHSLGAGKSPTPGAPTPTGIIMKKSASHCVLRPAGAASSMKGAPRAQKEASPRPT